MEDLPEQKNTETKPLLIPAAKPELAAGLVEVVLITDHEHAGELKQAGDSILVTQQQHAWLQAQGCIE